MVRNYKIGRFLDIYQNRSRQEQPFPASHLPSLLDWDSSKPLPTILFLPWPAENANNPDGVRGHPNWNTIPTYLTPNANDVVRNDGKYICRFGKKASVYSLLQQTVNALNQDIGITSSYDPLSTYYLRNVDPKISDNTVQALEFYLRALASPTQRNQTDPTVMRGQVVFEQAGCASCHRETLTTGFSPVDSISYQQFHPFTDLLVHDMGPGLDDHYTEGTAQTSEWRTAPLWGLGLAQNSQGGQFILLHDGRAHTIQQAIQMHGGEATTSVNRFNALIFGRCQRAHHILTIALDESEGIYSTLLCWRVSEGAYSRRS